MVTQGNSKLVAIVDDDDSMRSACRLLQSAEFPSQLFASAEEFLKSGQQHQVACLIADIRMPGMSGLELQAQLNAERCRIPIIFITAHGDEKIRMQALRAGAVEFFMAKPFDDERCSGSECFVPHWRVERSSEGCIGVRKEVLVQLSQDSDPLTKTVIRASRADHRWQSCSGIGPRASRAGRAHDSTVLIQGETGTGKELIAARNSHLSARCGRPSLNWNGAAIPFDLLGKRAFWS